ncbi:DUF3237 family protein [Paenibacillus alkaliterrae]|uniref:DUF3237 family protein n=1 Tax=Paenibacillus alkaliterrae TaxID=320909 RepID=UPI001F20ABE9|nr:DUF3237 family protein [Paenibacillus alkaliterrae]MCF2939743.1 DUF3237 family protein [Paenibacillus alkaliterrae]
MAISDELILEWIDRVSEINGLQMDPEALADDVVLMALIFNVDSTFVQGMNSVVRAITQLIDGVVSASQLEQNDSGWDSYHFQSQRVQGHRADLRVVFQNVDHHTVRIKGFGHRHLPSDIYKRLKPR